MENYAPNSHKARQEKKELAEKKKVEKVVRGKVKVKKKGELGKLAGMFVSEDVQDVKSYVIMDVLIPTIKKTISDIIIESVEMIFGTGRGNKRSRADKVSYTSYYDRRDRDRREERSSRASRYDLDDIVLDSRGEAEEVLARMDELLDAYKIVSVADLYDLLGETCDYTDNKYGWTNLRNADVIRVRDGYKLKLPKVLPID